MNRLRSRSHCAALLAVVALGVHELRYLLAPITDSGALAARHGYLAILAPVLALALAGALGQRLSGLAGAHPGQRRAPEHPASWTRVWLAAAAALLILYVAQETLEALLSGAQGGALSVPLRHGGWIAAPLAAGMGALIALVLRVPESPLAAVAGAARPRAAAGTPIGCPPFREILTSPRAGVLARHLAGRAPPGALGHR